MWYVIQVKTGEESGIARRLKTRQSEPRFPLRTVPSGLVGHGQKGIYSVPRICVPGHGFHGQKLLPGKKRFRE